MPSVDPPMTAVSVPIPGVRRILLEMAQVLDVDRPPTFRLTRGVSIFETLPTSNVQIVDDDHEGIPSL